MGILQMMGGAGGTPLTVNLSGVYVNVTRKTPCGNPGVGDVTSTPGTDVLGGSGNYTYLWESVGTPATHGPWVCSDIHVANPHWSAPDIICQTDNSIETWRLTVIDSSTGQVASRTIQVEIEFTQFP